MNNQDDKELFNQVKDLPSDFLTNLKAEVKETRNLSNKRKKLFYTITPVLSAACILTVLYISFFTNSPSFSKEYIASSKIKSNIVLPDKSNISLDVNTTLKVEYFENQREISLSYGKALFDVAKNKKRPFLIKTNSASIQVLGTRFEVINKNDSFEVNVSEGTVKVFDPRRNNKTLALVTRGQSLVLDKYLDVKEFKNIEGKIANWSRGKFIFNQTSLGDVLKEFSKYIEIDVQIQNDELRNLPISGNFDAFHFQDFLNVLPLVHAVKVQKEDNKIIIKKRI